MGKQNLTVWTCDNCSSEARVDDVPLGWSSISASGRHIEIACGECNDAVSRALANRRVGSLAPDKTRAEQLLALAAEVGELRAATVIGALGVGERSANQLLSRVAARGLLVRVGFGVYRLPADQTPVSVEAGKGEYNE